jgi:hypothetical protein
VHVRVRVRVHVRVRVRVRVRVHVHVHAHTRLRVHVHVCVHVRMHVHVRVYVHVRPPSPFAQADQPTPDDPQTTVRLLPMLQALSDSRCRTVKRAEKLQWVVEHGWAYAFTNAGAGRESLSQDATVNETPVDLFAAHDVQPTSTLAPVTMAWVVDIDDTSCGGCVRTILRRYEEAVLEVMLESGVTLDGSMQPPELPTPFLYRPMEDAEEGSGIRAHGVRTERTRYFMRVRCGGCSRDGWLTVQEGHQEVGNAASKPVLECVFPASLHAEGCSLASADTLLRPSLRKVNEAYAIKVRDGLCMHVIESLPATADAESDNESDDELTVVESSTVESAVELTASPSAGGAGTGLRVDEEDKGDGEPWSEELD